MENKHSRDQVGRQTEGEASGAEANDPLQELMVLVDDDGEIHTVDMDGAGSKKGGDIDGIDELLIELRRRPPSRLTMLMHRVAQSLMALRGLRAADADSWRAPRVPEAHWRALADEALGLLGDAARRELDEQRLMDSMPEAERQSFQKVCDSRRGLGVFRKSFEREREAWEQAYWRRALDESFGKIPWVGPSGRVSG